MLPLLPSIPIEQFLDFLQRLSRTLANTPDGKILQNILSRDIEASELPRIITSINRILLKNSRPDSRSTSIAAPKDNACCQAICDEAARTSAVQELFREWRKL